MTSIAKRSPDEYPPHVLREYALIADGERGAIIGPRGDIVWMCVPHWDSDAVFSALIGGQGAYAVTPVSRFVWGGYYEKDSLIWRSRWTTTAGIIECREAFAFPGDPNRAVLLRRIKAVTGDAKVRVVLEPRGQYGTRTLTNLTLDDSGVWIGRTASVHLRWSGAETASVTTRNGQRVLTMDLVVPAGTEHDLVLEMSEQPLPDGPVDAAAAWQATEASWHGSIPALDGCLAPSDTRHSYTVLRGMTSASGGMVAAATTSLPERAEAGRNYDYRYVWIRDQCYSGLAGAAIGAFDLVDNAVRFIGHRLLEHGARLAPAYTTSGGLVPDERQLGLPGYPGGADIIGNWANKQFQLDAFGESLSLFASAARVDRLDTDGWHAARVAADAIAERWTEPDAGIWEIDNRPWTHSRLTCASGLRAIAAARPSNAEAVDWLSLADRIVAHTSAHALNSATGAWQRSPDDAGLDAALLLPGLRGAVPPEDPRTVATFDAYARDLTVDGYAYRFRQDERPLGEAEGAFQLCGFLMALTCHQQGDALAARGWFERTRAACGPAQLYSEEYDVAQHQMRGNVPQAFVHALMIESAARLEGEPAHQTEW